MRDNPVLYTRDQPALKSWFMGGFEGSTFQFHDLRRVDVIAGSEHDKHCATDYRMLATLGIRTMRDTLRWHCIETSDGQYDWSSFEHMLEAARNEGVQVIWDICHFGLPGHVDLLDDSFAERFADFAEAAARVHKAYTDDIPWWCPINEISYWSYAAGAVGFMHPSRPGTAHLIKRQLVHASTLAIRRLREVDPRARIMATDPLIHVAAVDADDDPNDALAQRRASLDAFDMLLGCSSPELGGDRANLDVLGLNFYPHNEWTARTGSTIDRGMNGYRLLRYLLQDVWNRYRIPIVISETGADGDRGPDWLNHVVTEVEAAQDMGVDIMGICIYPVMDFPAWVDGSHCQTGIIRRGADNRNLCPDMSRTLANVGQQTPWRTRRARPAITTHSRTEPTMSDNTPDQKRTAPDMLAHADPIDNESTSPDTIAPPMPRTSDVPDIPSNMPTEGTPQPAATTGPTTPSETHIQPADAHTGTPGDNEDERLDEALQETMFTSDPVSIKIA